MKIRGVKESADRYVRHSVRAYLEGEQNFVWVVGVIRRSGVDLLGSYVLFMSLTSHAGSARWAELNEWFQSALSPANK